uniref:ExbD/TolR family protein n=1 Tax=Acaryochloris sp. IP29b_bin.137 TaxID=2969217 RepID=UPI00262A6D51
NILPLIDVIFAILAFFILSSLFLTQIEGFQVNLPNAENARPRDQADFTVTIQPDGAVALDQQAIELKNLRTAIQESLQPNQIAIITLKADKEVYHGDVIAVMDELRTIEGAKLGVATERSSN